jgi:hypothetical protein
MSAMTATLGRMPGLMRPVPSMGQSEPAKLISNMQEEIRKHLLTSYVIAAPTEQASARLEEVWSEASRSGWDGYGAKAIDPFAYMYARFFVNALPNTAPIPEVSADSDGEVALDWFFGDRKALTVSIGPTGRCTFAWMNGQSTNRGTDWMQDDVPASILFALAQLARSAGLRCR